MDGQTSETDSGHPAGREGGARHWRGHFYLGLAILGVFTLGKLALGTTAVGHWLHQRGYELFQLTARHPVREGDQLPVTLVDINELRPAGAPEQTEFPRDELLRLIETIWAAGPVAVGVDIDLSPDVDGSNAGGSFALLNRCLQLTSNSNSRIFLGVHRMTGHGRAAWLGDTNFMHLAATITRSGDWAWKTVHEIETRVDGSPLFDQLPSLSHALARAYTNHPVPGIGYRPPRLWPWLAPVVLESDSWRRTRDFRATEILVDYSRRERLEREAIKYSSITNHPQGEWLARVSNNVVILGIVSGESARDAGIAPGDVVVGGVQVHANAVCTLILGPLYELRGWASLGLSVLLSLLVLWCVQKASQWLARGESVYTAPLNIVLSLALSAIICLLAWLLARYAHLLWLDVPVLIMVIVGHCYAEIFVDGAGWDRIGLGCRQIRQGLLNILKGLIPQRQPSPQMTRPAPPPAPVITGRPADA